MEKKVIECVKGFNKDLKCKGFQYEVGKEYETDSIEICRRGFHAIDESEPPLTVFKYYSPCDSYGNPNRFCLVELSGKTMKEGDKTVGSKIKIVKEIGVEGVIWLQRQWSKANSVNDDSFKHDDYSFASNTGDFSSAINTGDYSSASNTGDYSSASNTGNRSVVTNTGIRSIAVNTGKYSLAGNTGVRSLTGNTGYSSVSTNTGDYSSAANTGYCSSASNTGDGSLAGNTGFYSTATNTGNYSVAANTGNHSSAEVCGRESIAAVYGMDCKAKGALGCALVLTERGDWDNDIEGYPLKNIVAVIVDGVNVKADTFYMLVDGKLKECK